MSRIPAIVAAIGAVALAAAIPLMADEAEQVRIVTFEQVLISEHGALALLQPGPPDDNNGPPVLIDEHSELPPGMVQAQPLGVLTPLAPLPELSAIIPDFSLLQPDYGARERLTRTEAADVLRRAAVPEEWHADMLAIGWCESKLRPKAVGDGGMSRGFLQLWTGWAAWYGVEVEALFDPVVNAAVAGAVRKYRGRFGGKGGWTCADLLGIR